MQPSISHTIPSESLAIARLVKNKILLADETASVILFGSRARGDAENDSDWDFLILTKQTDTDLLSDKFRRIILRDVELKYDMAISLIVKNATLWQTDYAVTNIYKSVNEEGILL
ncbi:MAG TPA: nucleotidyltransferase domain-containing protein [Hanamia sp.]|nr:nucleotidyltransferase domain-containing protein [Hanamia sp.]